MKKQIFITGATGYVGQHLVRSLLKSGHSLHALIENDNDLPFRTHSRFNYIIGDINDTEKVYTAMKKCTEVYHLAAYVRPWAKDPSVYFRVNVDGTRNVLETAKSLGIRKVVVTSTCSIMAPSLGKPSDENTERKVPLFNHYDVSKSKMEKLVGDFALNGLNVVIVNVPRIYGPGLKGQNNTITDLIRKYMDGKWKLIPGEGDKLGSYIYIDDVVTGHLLAMKKGLKGERYILAGDNRSLNDLFSIVREKTGIKNKLYKIPLQLILSFSYLSTKYSSLMGKQPKLPYDWTCKIVYDWALSGNKAAQQLGYQITSLEEGISQTIQWLRHDNA